MHSVASPVFYPPFVRKCGIPVRRRVIRTEKNQYNTDGLIAYALVQCEFIGRSPLRSIRNSGTATRRRAARVPHKWRLASRGHYQCLGWPYPNPWHGRRSSALSSCTLSSSMASLCSFSFYQTKPPVQLRLLFNQGASLQAAPRIVRIHSENITLPKLQRTSFRHS